MWYDPVADLVFLFGGSNRFYEPNDVGYLDGYGPWNYFGGQELWGYDVDTNTWTLFRVDPNPGFVMMGSAAFDTTWGVAVLAGGDRLDAERRSLGSSHQIWTYRHTP
jgi:hypothetical protein